MPGLELPVAVVVEHQRIGNYLAAGKPEKFGRARQAKGRDGGENLPKSQAIKDATMAYFILKNWSKGKTVIHYNGSYHSDYHEGIEWYLKQGNPNLKILTIGSTEQEAIDTLAKDAISQADYILCIPESMTKTQ